MNVGHRLKYTVVAGRLPTQRWTLHLTHPPLLLPTTSLISVYLLPGIIFATQIVFLIRPLQRNR